MKGIIMAPVSFSDVIRGGDSANILKLGGHFLYECFGPDGELKWVDKSHNNLTKEGLNHVLDILFAGAAQVNPWYVGIYTAFAGALSDLTGADIGGNLTEFTNYTGTRKTYDDVRTNQTTSNTASKAQFAILGAGTILGSFLASDASGAAPKLLCLDAFASGSRIVGASDTLRVTYEFTADNI